MSLGLAAMKAATRRAVRAPINPIDKCSIISIFPKDIHERKITLQPGDFFVPAGSYEHPSILVIGPSSWWRDVGEDEPLLEIPHSSPVMAESIVKDYINGMIGCDMRTAMPGLFWLPGEITVQQLKTTHKLALDNAKKFQTAYYQALLKMADSLWARTNGNPLAIPHLAKLAATELGVNRDWTSNFVQQEIVKCVACGAIRNPAFPVCPNCKMVVDTEKAKTLGIKFAE